jgi:DNA-binding SARP family transcriptional activator/Tfp pilus assembly protein PilF
VFGVLGPVQVRVGEGGVVVTARRERTLLAMLLLHANRVVPVDELVDALWPADPPREARGQVQGCVHRLRQQFARAGVAGQVIATGHGGYRAAVDPEHLDLLEFRRLVTAARAAARGGRQDEAVDCYRAALALWRGPALSDIDSHVLRQAATALDEERLQVQEERIRAELAAGAAGQLAGDLTGLVRQHPHREGLHHALMLALYRAGRQADALAAYRKARELLREELGTEPGPELRRLHRAILNRDPALDLAAPAPPGPAATGTSTPRELPADVFGFTGRAGALKSLDEMLISAAEGTHGPVVISAIAGTAGVGKTALAVRWAHRVADRFPDGQLYINLRGYAAGAPLRPIESLAMLLRSLGTAPERVPTEEAQAAALYRTVLADRRVLVVLDNASSVDQVRPLLPGSPGCLVLVTSRDRLAGLVARDGARRLTLDVLTPDEACTLLTRVVSADRVQTEPEAVAELAKVCAYLPLALRIAAAHLLDRPDRGIAAYVSELTATDPLTTLQADGDDESAVRTALDRSYRSLPAATRRMFRLLGLSPGPDFSPAAAAALAGVPRDEAALQLRQLATAHLIDGHAAARYTFHDLLRLYARTLAEAEEGADHRTAAVQRLLRYYLLSADAAASVLYPEMLRLPPPSAGEGAVPEVFHRPAMALAWLAAERVNLVAAVVYAATYGPRRLSWLMALPLRGYLCRAGYAVDLLSVASVALAAADEEADSRARAVAHFSLAHFCDSVARYSEAIDHYTSAADLSRQADWADGEAAALNNLGSVHVSMGRLAQAADHYAASLTMNVDGGRIGGQAINRCNLGLVYYELGRLDDAAGELTQALALHRQTSLGVGEATYLSRLANVNHQLSQFDAAHTYATAALVVCRKTGDKLTESVVLGCLAEVHADAGRSSEALDHALAGAALAAEVDDPARRAVTQYNLGNVQLRRGWPNEALEHHGQALDLARRTAHGSAQVNALLGVAAARHLLGDLDPGDQAARQCLELAQEAGYRVLEGQALTVLAGILLDQGRVEQASATARRALDNHRETGHRLGEARTLAVLGRIAEATGEPEAARWHRCAALAIFHDVGSPPPDDIRVAGGPAS